MKSMPRGKKAGSRQPPEHHSFACPLISAFAKKENGCCSAQARLKPNTFFLQVPSSSSPVGRGGFIQRQCPQCPQPTDNGSRSEKCPTRRGTRSDATAMHCKSGARKTWGKWTTGWKLPVNPRGGCNTPSDTKQTHMSSLKRSLALSETPLYHLKTSKLFHKMPNYYFLFIQTPFFLLPWSLRSTAGQSWPCQGRPCTWPASQPPHRCSSPR